MPTFPFNPTAQVQTGFQPPVGLPAYTFTQIAYRAIRLAGGVQAGTTVDPETLQDALDECNSMLDSWDAEQLSQQFYDDRYFNITVSKPIYTIGPTGDFSTDVNGVPLLYKPNAIVWANFILQSTTSQPVRVPINIVEVEDFAAIPLLGVQTLETTTMYVVNTVGNTTLYCYPYPNTGAMIEFFMWPGIAKIQTLASTLTINSGGLDAIVYNLAERMFLLLPKDLGRAALQRGAYLTRMALRTKRVFETSNAVSVNLTPDIAIGGNADGAPFNYLTGDYS